MDKGGGAVVASGTLATIPRCKKVMTRLQYWHDDRQVVSLRCQKIYAENGYWQVSLLPIRKEE